MNGYLVQFIKPELLILVPVLFSAGALLKKSRIHDYYIPLILGVAGIVLSTIWTIGTSFGFAWQGLLMEIFTGVTQGILAAAVSVYVSQLMKQWQQAQRCRICEAGKRGKQDGNAGQSGEDGPEGGKTKDRPPRQRKPTV